MAEKHRGVPILKPVSFAIVKYYFLLFFLPNPVLVLNHIEYVALGVNSLF